MAFTVATDLTDIDLAESATPWTTGALDPAKYVQGSNSIGWYASKNSRSVNGVSSKSIAHSAGDHLYWWNASDVIAVAEAQTTGTATASGVTIRVTLSDGAYREWHVAGSDTWDGGWRCFVVDLAHTGTHLYASSGTWSTANNITDVDIYIDLSNSGNIRNVPANNYADAIRVGTGLTAYNTSAADPSFDFADIAAVAEATTQQYGVTETKDGVIFLQGRITLGDTGTNHLDFDSQNEVVVFSPRDGTDGFGLVGNSLYQISGVGNATGTDQEFSMGIKVGTGDAASGRNGTQILSGGTAVRYTVDISDTDLHTITLYGVKIAGAYETTTTDGVIFGSPTTTGEVAGCTFDGCSQVDPSDLTFRNCFVLNSQAGTTEAAFGPWVGGTTDIKNSSFINNPNAIVFEATPTGDETDFDNLQFIGNTYAVRNESNGNDFTVNLINGTTSLTTGSDNNDVGTSTLTFAASYAYTLTNIENPSEVTILDRDVSLLDITGTEVAQPFGDDTNNAVGQSLQVTTAGKMDRARLALRKYGSPTDSVYAQLRRGTALADFGDISALYFPGTNEYVDTTTNPDVTSTSNDFEIRALIRLTDYTPTSLQPIVDQTSATSWNFRFFLTTAGALSLNVGTASATQTLFAGTALSATDNEWLWVRVVYDHDGGVGASDAKASFYYSNNSSEMNPDIVSWTAAGTEEDTQRAMGSLAQPIRLGYTANPGNYATGKFAWAAMWTDGTAATGDKIFETDWRTGVDFNATDQRKDDATSLIWELQGTAPVYKRVIASQEIDADDLTTTLTDFDMQFNELYSLAASTDYAFEIYRTGAQSATNYFGCEYSTTSVHANGVRHLAKPQSDYPVPADRADEVFDVDATAHTVSLTDIGTISVGDGILMVAVTDSQEEPIFPNEGTDWIAVVSEGTSGSWTKVVYRKATGSEGTSISVTLGAAENMVVRKYRFDSADIADWATTPPEGTIVDFPTATTNPDPPSHTVSWASGEDNWWLAGFGWNSDYVASAFPSDTTDTGSAAGAATGGCTAGWAERYETQLDTWNPTTFTVGSNNGQAFTIVVRAKLGNVAWETSTGDLILSIMDAPSENQLYHVENVTTGSTTYTHSGTVKDIEVLVAALIYQQVKLIDSLGSEAKSVPILQIPDLVYSNP